MLTDLGVTVNPWLINVVLPVGISFYTFHGLSYVFDIYNSKIKPVYNVVDYSVFVSFFPLLVAGPIERATHLLPQVQRKRVFEYSRAVDGLRQILWGLFKKVVIADGCAEVANFIFNNSSDYTGATLLLGAVFFAFQIYGDFSGYSDIALGTARLFGFELLRNFSYPYFSRNIAEFWRRWHISLSSWFRDYVYFPLGGSRGNLFAKIRNVLIIFLLSGFWHGANWTFIFWGLLNALYFLPSLVWKTNRDFLDVVAKDRILPTGREFFQISFTFLLVTLAWIFFRANSLEHAFNYCYALGSGMFKLSSYNFFLLFLKQHVGFVLPALLILFFSVEWMGRQESYPLAKFGLKWHWVLRWSFYYGLILCLFLFAGKEQQFIYFQF